VTTFFLPSLWWVMQRPHARLFSTGNGLPGPDFIPADTIFAAMSGIQSSTARPFFQWPTCFRRISRGCSFLLSIQFGGISSCRYKGAASSKRFFLHENAPSATKRRPALAGHGAVRAESAGEPEVSSGADGFVKRKKGGSRRQKLDFLGEQRKSTALRIFFQLRGIPVIGPIQGPLNRL